MTNAAITLAVTMLAVNFYLGAAAFIPTIGEDVRAAAMVDLLNAILEAAPQHGDFVILITDKCSLLDHVAEVAAPWGMGMFEVAGSTQDANVTQAQLSRVVGQARKLRQMSLSVTVMVVSDDPVFLDAFAKWSLEGRLLIWSTKLLVLTHLPLHHLQHIHNTLAMTNSMLLHFTYDPSFRVQIYTELPYSQPGTQPVTLATWSPGKGFAKKSSTSFYFDKFSRLTHRPRVVVSRVVVPTDTTVTIDDPDYPGEKKVMGFNSENNLMETIAASMNFPIKYVEPGDGQWGMMDNDGEWTGMVGMVDRKEADIALGLFTITPQRYEVVDFTYPVAITYMCILAARGSPEVTVWGFLLPLTPFVWVGIMVALVVCMAVMLAPSCLSTESLNQSRLFSSTYNCVRVMLQQDVSEGSGWWWWERVVLGVWMLMTLVLTRSYTGNLMSQLAVRYIPEPLQSLQDLVDNPVTIILYKGTAEEQAFRTAKSGVMRDVWSLTKEDRIMLVDTEELTEVQSMLSEGSAALVGPNIYLQMRIANEFTEKGMCDFYIGDRRYRPSMDALAGPKDSLMVLALGRKVMQVTEAGLYNHWNGVYTPNLTSCNNSPTKFAIKSSLAMSNIWGMFMVLVGGSVVSLIVFCVEIIWSRR